MIGPYSFQEILLQRENYRKQKDSLLDFLQDLQKDVEKARPIKGRLKDYLDYALKESNIFDFGLENAMINLPKPKDQMESVKMKLFDEALKKPVREVFQIDGYNPEQCDSLIKPDEQGYGMMSWGKNQELRASNNPIRIQIMKGTKREAALYLIKRAHDWLESDWENLIWEKSFSQIASSEELDIPI